MQGVKKEHLPSKICLVCQKPFSWRKKWQKNWHEVKYCSNRCQKTLNMSKQNILLPTSVLTEIDIDRIIEMAWEDRTPFEAIEHQFGLDEQTVVELMRKNSKLSSFKMWRKRMAGRKTKHDKLRNDEVKRFKCSRQRLTGNKIAKR